MDLFEEFRDALWAKGIENLKDDLEMPLEVEDAMGNRRESLEARKVRQRASMFVAEMCLPKPKQSVDVNHGGELVIRWAE